MADEWKYKDLPRAANGVAPAKWDEELKEWVVYTGVNDVKAVGVEDRLTAIENKLDSVIQNGSVNTQVIGSNAELNVNVLNQPEPYNPRLQEQLSETDAVVGTLTFSDVLKEVEIYNRDINDGVFTINNLAITVPADTSFQAEVGGTPGNTVNVTGSTSYIVGRYA